MKRSTHLSLFGPTDDFFSDRLCHRYGVIVLVGVAVMMTYAWWRDGAVVCWTPSEFTTSHMDYANSRCRNNDFYYLPLSEEAPVEPHYTQKGYQQHQVHNLGKYFPTVLLFQTIFFLAPRASWTLLNCVFHSSVQSIITAAHHVVTHGNSDCGDDYASIASCVTAHLNRPLAYIAKLPLNGFALTIVYMLIKTGYACAYVVQFAVLSWFFDFNFATIWAQYLNRDRLYTPTDYRAVSPPVILCDFEV